MDTQRLKVPVESLTAVCDPQELGFESTEELTPLEGTIGQERAVTALEFGLHIRTQGYNVFVSGLPGTGRNTTLASYLRSAAERLSVPPDWCYVHNFDDPARPWALSLPAGMGAELARDMEDLVSGCRRDLPRAFEGPDYQEKVQEVLEDIQAKRTELSNQMEQEARQRSFSLQFTPMGIATTPLSEDGKPLDQESFDHLSEEVRNARREASEQLQAFVQERVAEIRRLDKEATQRRAQLDREVARFATQPLFDELRQKYGSLPRVVAYLDRVQADMVEHIDDFRSSDQQEEQVPAYLRQAAQEQQFIRYKVNVVINNAGAQAAPVVFEYSPTYYNLFGRIEYRPMMGSALTDLTMIKPGDIHRANGGFLVVQARDLLTSPLAWDTMKRTLRSQEARIENLGEQFSAVPFSTLNPEPIPLNTKIIMVGNPLLYRLLQLYDEDFHKFFKVKADFDISMDRTLENIQKYASFVVNRVRDDGLRPFDKAAVARLVEYSCRLVEHQDKLTTRFVDITDLITEANYWAGHDGPTPQVRSEHVERALREKIYRSNLPEERIREYITNGIIHIQTEGAVVGQVNGISVIDLGDYSFGRPVRITARTSLGRGEVANIEYEAQMAGRIHNKGFMILVGYLMGKYGQDKPVPVRASIGFEQTYDEIEGDSASSAELYTLLSSLANLPIKQSLAVTGSVNQHGQVQAVGGVTPKP